MAVSFSPLAEKAGSLLNQAAVLISILLGGFIIGTIAKRVTHFLLKEINLSWATQKVGFNRPPEEWLSAIVSYIIYILTIIVFLNRLGITVYVLLGVSGLVLLLLALSFLFGTRDLLVNSYHGLFIDKSQFRINKEFSFDNISGHIQRHTVDGLFLSTPDRDLMFIPYSLLRKR